ncbi:TPR-like protein [Pyrenochaeta sp. DS3sAY3a]|nr:TPR-like protein [Pyrenochaeta sp. DS3sAY3a]
MENRDTPRSSPDQRENAEDAPQLEPNSGDAKELGNIPFDQPMDLMGPPTRRRKRKVATIPAQDWEPYKARIIELHVKLKYKLPEVKQILEDEHGFVAEIRQYRTRISQWKMDKNVKPREMAAIVRKRQQRKLIEPERGELVFSVRGQVVEPPKIDRWMKGKNIPQSFLFGASPQASTPSDVDWRTISERSSPTPSSVATPTQPFDHGDMEERMASLSPAISVGRMIRSPSSTFNGQSPAPIYRTIDRTEIAGATSLAPSSSHLGPGPLTIPYRYRQTEEESLKVRLLYAESLHGLDHAETWTILAALSALYQSQGRYRLTGETLRRELESRQRVEGDTSTGTIIAMERLAQLLSYQGDDSKAEELHKRTLNLAKNVLGSSHGITIQCKINLAAVLNNQGQIDEAMGVLEPSLALAKALFGETNEVVLQNKFCLAEVYMNKGQLLEAEEMMVFILETRRRNYGSEHDYTLISMIALGNTYNQQRKFDKAEALLLEAFGRCQATRGEEHPDTLKALNHLARTYILTNRWAQAESLQLQIIESQKKVLGSEHPSTLIGMANLGYTYFCQRRFIETVELSVTVLETCRRVLRKNHPLSKSIAWRLAWSYTELGRWEDATALSEEFGFPNDNGPSVPTQPEQMASQQSALNSQELQPPLAVDMNWGFGDFSSDIFPSFSFDFDMGVFAPQFQAF